MSPLAVSMAAEIDVVVAGGVRSQIREWRKGYVVKEIGPVIKLLDLARGYVINMPPTHVREATP